ncbi:MAG TPA: septation protein SpoVG family protein [Phycisphaerae bacterium]|nr:septation protein SpoVG family protein [Phycisphaerae bacterium]
MVDISEVRVKLIGNSKDRLKAYCSITIGGNFVIRDLKIIDGTNGLFVAMPSRKLAGRCPACHAKNHLRAHYCNECGKKFPEGWAGGRSQGRNKLHADIAHPINAECRAYLQSRVIEEFEAELERSRQPGYQGSRYDDLDEDVDQEDASPYEELIRELKSDGATGKHEKATVSEREEATVSEQEEVTVSEPEAPAPADEREPPSRPEQEPASPPAKPVTEDEFGAGIL